MSTSLVDRVATHEQTLLRELSTGAAFSAVVGAGVLAWGAASGRGAATTFARQTLAWAAIDGIIAVLGKRGAAKPPTDEDDARARARRMRNVTGVNAVLDVGYIAGGIALTRWKNPERPYAAADGAAVIVQGAFLLWLDARHSRTFHSLLTP